MKKLVTMMLDKGLIEAIDNRVKRGLYSSRKEYFVDLVRQDMEGRNLQTKILAEIKKLEKFVK